MNNYIPQKNWCDYSSISWSKLIAVIRITEAPGYVVKGDQGLYSLRRRRLISIGIPIINLIRSSDRLRFIMGIPIPIRRRLLSEYRPSRVYESTVDRMWNMTLSFPSRLTHPQTTYAVMCLSFSVHIIAVLLYLQYHIDKSYLLFNTISCIFGWIYIRTQPKYCPK